MRYAVKYLAGAWKVSGGSEARAVHHYASGYYYAAKRRGIARQSYAMLDGGDMRYSGQVIALVAPSSMSPADPNYH
jgi:soluble lytic murein transglycosylase-like protein